MSGRTAFRRRVRETSRGCRPLHTSYGLLLAQIALAHTARIAIIRAVVWSFFRRQIRRRPSPRRALGSAASWLFGFRRHHVIGAGTLASFIGLYSYGAQVG